MKIKGKVLTKVRLEKEVEAYHFTQVQCRIDNLFLDKVWKKRSCFICGGKFKNGDNPVVAFVRHETNKIICEECFNRTGAKYGKQEEE